MRKQLGLSLIELMIAVTLGLILMTGVMQMFLSSRTVFSTQQGMSRIQESGRFAMEMMGRDIRMAGFMGCLNRIGPNISDSHVESRVTNVLQGAGTFPYDMSVGIIGFSGNPAGSNLNPAPIAGTDVLVVRSANDSIAAVSKSNTPNTVFVTNTLEVAGACPGNTPSYSGICTNDILVVADCFKARVFQATGVANAGAEVSILHGAGTPGNAIADWGGGSNTDENFGPGAEVLVINHLVYYVGISNVTGQPALFQNINGADPSLELLEGVENMRLTYSREATPDEFQAVAALPAGVWEDIANPVVAVRIELLLRSMDDGVLEEPQPYTFAGAAVTPTDRRMRQVFVNTVGIRSRLK